MTRLSLAALLLLTPALAAQVVLPTHSHDGTVGPLQAGTVYFASGNVEVPIGETLTVQPGAVIAFETGADLEVDGTLIAVGTAANPVVFTSICDTAFVTVPLPPGFTCTGAAAPGDWREMQFDPNSDASVLEHALVRYAGEGGIAALDVNSSHLTMTQSAVELCLVHAVDIGLGARPTITGCRFDFNGAPPIRTELRGMKNLRHNTAQGNTGGDYLLMDQMDWPPDGNMTIHPRQYPGNVLVASATMNVPAGHHLTIEAGVILKFSTTRALRSDGGALDIRGTGADPVVVTSLADDAWGGDTNVDGAVTQPSPGDWHGLHFNTASVPSTCEHVICRYGGTFYNSPVRIHANAMATLRHVRSEHGYGPGFRVTSHVGDAVGWVAYKNTGDGIRLEGGMFALRHATSVMNGMQGIQVQGFGGTISSSIAWNNAGGDFAGLGMNQLFTSCGSNAPVGQGNITSDPDFLDAATGDLDLDDDSPCAGTADFAGALLVAKDFRESPRILDHELNGTAAPDMGAYERAAYLLHKSGEARLGTTVMLTTTGAPGAGVLVGGANEGVQFFAPYGLYLLDAQTSILLGPSFVVGDLIPLALPAIPVLDGIPFAIQALCVSFLDPSRGNFTNLYRFEFFD